MSRSRLLLTIVLLVMFTSLCLWMVAQAEISQRDRIIFPHQLHVEEMEIECAACHELIETSTSAEDHNIPSMDFCGDCHDVEDFDNCGLCHFNPEEPESAFIPKRDYQFNHSIHISAGIDCTKCHSGIADGSSEDAAHLPAKPVCMECHDGDRASRDCSVCHDQVVTLLSIHPVDWKKQHGLEAPLQRDWCSTCHQSEDFCLACHRGDNLSGNIHDLNYRFTHGLDANRGEIDCSSCHQQETFCNGCHMQQLRMPWNHSTLGWLNEHGVEARYNVTNCASCHDQHDPTCARAGCHLDLDGVRGTDPAIHESSSSRFDRFGPWHDDGGYFCYQCHTDTKSTGVGFCGYCHD